MEAETDLIEMMLQQDAELKRLFEALPAMKDELNGELRLHLDRVASEAEQRSQAEVARSLAETQTNLMRFARNEFTRIDQEAKAAVLQVEESERKSFDFQKTKLAEIEADMPRKMRAILTSAFAEKRTEFEKENRETITRQLASSPKATFFDWFKGNWKKDVPYKRGDIFAFRGSCYIVEREPPVGTFPTQANQKGAEKLFSVVAAAGSSAIMPPLVSSIGGTAGQVLVNGGVNPVTGTLVTLSLASALTGINSITSAAANDLSLNSATGNSVAINGGAINNTSGKVGSLTVRGVSGGDVLQLYTSAGSGNQPFLRIDDSDGGFHIDSQITIAGVTNPTIPSSGALSYMLALQSDLNDATSAAIVIQASPNANQGFLLKGFDNASALKFSVNYDGAMTVSSIGSFIASGTITMGTGGPTLTAAGGTLTLAAITNGNVALSFPGTGGLLVSNNTSAQLAQFQATGGTPFNLYLNRSDLTNAAVQFFFDASGNLTQRNNHATGGLIFQTNNTTALTLNGSQNLISAGSITTAAPNGGTAGAWKFGIRVAATVLIDTTQYIQLDVGGTLYKMAIATT